MGWTAPRTWSPGETVTASLMNAHVRDNLNVLKTNIADSGALVLVERVRLLNLDTGDHATSGTGATDVWTYSLTGGTVADGERLVLHALGDQTADTNNKTILVTLGSTTYTTGAIAGVSPSRWEVIWTLTRISAAVQRVNYTVNHSGTGMLGTYQATTEDLSATKTLKLTLTHATAGTSTLRVARLTLERYVLGS